MANQSDYVRVYKPPDVAKTLIGSPRFGHTSDISSLLGDSAEANDYKAGLAVAAMITAFCFLLAMVCILVFMLCGKKRFGFLSGAQFETRGYGDDQSSRNSLNSFSSPMERSPEKSGTYNRSNHGCCGVQTATWVRCTFILSGIIFIVFAVLLVTQEAEGIVDTGFRGIRGVANETRNELEDELAGNNFCPADPTLQNNAAAAEIRSQADQALTLLNMLDDFLGNQVDAISAAIGQVQKGAQEVQDRTGNINLTDWEALLVLIPYTLVPSLLVAAAIMAHFDVEFTIYTCLINWFLAPLFIVMVVVCAGVASAMIFYASANADFCLPGGRPGDSYPGDSPDTTVYRMLDRKGYNQTTLVRQVADYYVSQCLNAEDPFAFLTDYLPNLTESQKTLAELTATVESNSTLSEISTYCNRDFSSFGTLLSQMGTILDALLDAVNRTIDLISCERIVPIYDHAIYDGACLYSVSAVFWVFSASLIMGTFGLLMILFRSAYKPTIYVDVGGPVVDEDGDSPPKVYIYEEGTSPLVY